MATPAKQQQFSPGVLLDATGNPMYGTVPASLWQRQQAPNGSYLQDGYGPTTIILESGGPLGAWRTEQIDLKQEFRRHFSDGDTNAEVPDFVGVGIMTDGDQTKSESSADYASFVLQR